MLFRRDSAESWHGSLFIVVNDGIIVHETPDLSDAYITYNGLLG